MKWKYSLYQFLIPTGSPKPNKVASPPVKQFNKTQRPPPTMAKPKTSSSPPPMAPPPPGMVDTQPLAGPPGVPPPPPQSAMGDCKCL